MGMLSQVILNTWAASLRLRASFVCCSKGNSPLCSDTTVHSSPPIGKYLSILLSNAYVLLVENPSPRARVVPVALVAGAVQEASLLVTSKFCMMWTRIFLSSRDKIRRWREFGFEMSSGMFVCVEFCHAIWICDEPRISHYLRGVRPLKAKCNLWQDFWGP